MAPSDNAFARGWITAAICMLAGTVLVGLALSAQPERPGETRVTVIASDPAAARSASVPSAVAGESAEPSSTQRSADVSMPAVGVASRLVIPDLGVDLPVVSGQLSEVPENPGAFPLCDVAQYLESYVQPGQIGTTYLFGHARRGMLAPLLEASQVRDGERLLGARVLVYTSDARLHFYEIFAVNRHAIDFALAYDIAPGEDRLVIQTSEGTRATEPKLQVAARPVEVVAVSISEALPSPAPRICG